MRLWIWIAAMIAIALAGGWAEQRLAVASEFFRDPSHSYDVAYAFTLPIHLVQSAYPGWPVLAALWGMLACLALAGWQLARALGVAGRPALVVASFIAVAAVLTSFSTVHSGDLYYYVMYGRLYGLHGLNPYALGAAPVAAGDQVIAQIAGYTKNPPYGDPYGPLWTLMAGGIARLEAGASLWWQAWSYRALAVAAAALVLAALLYVLRREPPQERCRRAALFAFHPLVLYETAVGGHNEILMLAPAAWAFALVDELPLLAGVLLGASVAIKYVSVLALPFLIAIAWRKSAVAGVLCGLFAIAIPSLCFRPFWLGDSTLHAASGNINVLAMSPSWLLSWPFFAAGTAGLPVFGGVPALPLVGVLTWPRLIQLLLVFGFLCVAAWSAIRFVKDQSFAHLWRTVTGFIWASPIVHPWYLLWLAPAVSATGRWAVYAWWFAALIPLRYILEGLAIQSTWALVSLTGVIFAVPVFIAMRTGAKASGLQERAQ
ncbi:MAG TPA: glycosyltransferase 87 family protein [Candidatus Tumulicola sp.]|nr:glycosyltransferase 87 family protein [Candidatus Tumulicola sp.]